MLIIIGFVFFAAFGDAIAPYDSEKEMLAVPLARPQWFTLLPGYSDWPPTQDINVMWIAEPGNVLDLQFREDPELASLLKREKILVWSAKYIGNFSQEIQYKLSFNFAYNWRPPELFECKFRWRLLNLKEMGYNLELALSRYDGREYSLWDSNYKLSMPKESEQYSYRFDAIPVADFPRLVELRSGSKAIYESRLNFSQSLEFLNEAFSGQGNYTLTFYIRLKPTTTGSSVEIQIFDFDFSILGSVHGFLGTDDRGRDIFSRIVCGTKISLMAGLLVATVAASLGVFVGVISGYFGGLIDDMSMRMVDLLMCLPLLPLLLAVAEMFKRNLFAGLVVIVILSWMPLARMVRSQVLSLREMAFVEAAKAMGCSKLHIIIRHITPNVAPLAFSFMILSIPSAILIEAGLSFLGLSDPALITWGRVINEAMTGGALARDAWWWLFSPGIAIVAVCLGFIFVAHALDEIVNPRLRQRK